MYLLLTDNNAKDWAMKMSEGSSKADGCCSLNKRMDPELTPGVQIHGSAVLLDDHDGNWSSTVLIKEYIDDSQVFCKHLVRHGVVLEVFAACMELAHVGRSGGQGTLL